MKVSITTLGCDKNRVDSERLASFLRSSGFELIADDESADMIIINTCGFINTAREESLNAISQKIKFKPRAKIIVCGCMVEKYKDELTKQIPQVDVWWGTKDYEQLVENLSQNKLIKGHKLLSTPKSYTYIKISEGCNRACAFCTIPSIKGRYISRTIDEIIEEVEHFAGLGVPEYILVAQDVTSYGIDIGTNLVNLLRSITNIKGVKRVRLHYCYPDMLSDELIKEIASNEKIVKYLDIPFQHCSDRIIKAMRRKGGEVEFENLITKLRMTIKDLTIRATFIVGFPTETEQEFDQLVQFLKYVKLDYVGFFIYSREQGTPAYDMQQVDEEVKGKRLAIIESVQSKILEAKDLANKGKKVKVVCDEILDGASKCRTFGQSPEVDPCVIVDGELEVGGEYDIIL